MTEQTKLPARTPSEQGIGAVFGRLRNEIDELFEEITVPGPMRRVLHMPNGVEFSPAIELKDRKAHYELTSELPGLDEKDIGIEFADGVLSISGEKREESEEQSHGCLISERSYGSFHRRLSLPPDIDPDRIEAKFRNGVLHVTIGKDKNAADRVRKIKLA